MTGQISKRGAVDSTRFGRPRRRAPARRIAPSGCSAPQPRDGHKASSRPASGGRRSAPAAGCRSRSQPAESPAARLRPRQSAFCLFRAPGDDRPSRESTSAGTRAPAGPDGPPRKLPHLPDQPFERSRRRGAEDPHEPPRAPGAPPVNRARHARTTPAWASSAPIRESSLPPRSMRAPRGVRVSHSVGGSTRTTPLTACG